MDGYAVRGMGEILGSRRHDGDTRKVVLEILLSQDELRQLRGEMENVIVIAESAGTTPSRVSLRGRNEATKYFLIPRQLRKQLSIHGSVSCQRLDVSGKSVFVYIVSP